MRKAVAVALLLSLCFTATQSLKAQSRPRRVEQPVSAPQTQTDEASAQNENRRPPTLKGNVNNGQQNTQQTTATAETDDGTVEVGEGDVVRVETALVTIPVSVMDRSGRYIPNLRQEDFRVFEDGVEHEVAYFASVEKPFTVALVLDTSGSTQFRLDEIQDAAIAFVDQLRPDDRVMVIAFAESVQVLSEPTNDRRALRNAIRRTHTGGGTSLYDTVDFVINQKFNRIEGRKAIVLFTDGVDTTSKRATYQSNVTDAEEVDALIYPVQYDTSAEMSGSSGGPMGRAPSKTETVAGILIGILGGGRVYGGRGGGGRRGGGGGRGSNRADYERADRYLEALAQKTGARRYRAENTRLEQSFALVAEELRRQYSIGYYPHNVAQAGQRRQIKVRVNRPDLVVRARDSYTSTASSNTAQNGQQQSSPPEIRRRPFVAVR